jgi:fermentation-respiration switch protein FrsA (DUF1100 family)
MGLSSLGRIVLGIVYAALVVYVSLCVAARVEYRRLLYPAPDDPLPVAPPGATMLELRAADGVAVHAIQFPPPSDQARTVVVFHGNGETIANGVDLGQDLQRRGFGAVLAEYRGYGVSRDSGPPSERGLYLDAESVLDALQAQGIGRERVVLMGCSLGTGIAAEMARRGRAASLVLVSPYTSITAMAKRIAAFLPVSLVCPDAFDTLSKAPEIHVPTLVVHGDRDEVVPVEMGRAVAGAIPGAALRIVPGGHHGDLFALPGVHTLEVIAQHAAANAVSSTR